MRARSPLLALLLLVSSATATLAQRAPLKRGRPVATARAACPSIPIARPGTPQQRTAARDLAHRAQQAAILGDRVAARDQLKQAATLDPLNPEFAYQLARAQEAAGSADEAALEYCRFVALTPNAPEAGEARDRIAALSRATQSAMSDRTFAPFRDALAAYDAGRLAQAEGLFTTAIGLQPDWADAYYDRALTYAARGSRELAVRDLQQYLRLKPEAEDRSAVVARINTLRGSPLSPATALTLGLVIPGAGQFYTGRKLFGIVAMGAAGASIAYALKHDPVLESYQATGLDPFGNPYTFTDTRTVLGRPHTAAGLAGLGAVALVTSVEAFTYARRINTREQRVSATLLPSMDGLALRLTLR